MWPFATDLKVISSLSYNQNLYPIITLLKSQVNFRWWWLSHMQMDSLRALVGVATYSIWALAFRACFFQAIFLLWLLVHRWVTPSEGSSVEHWRGTQNIFEVLTGKVLMLWNRLLLQGKILLSCPWTRGCSKAYNGRFVCILIPILICRDGDGFTLIVFPSEQDTYSS